MTEIFFSSSLIPSQVAVLISLGFIGCWAPYGMVSLYSVLRDSSTIPPVLTVLPCMFAKSSTVYNPLIYYIFSQSFRKEVQELRRYCPAFKSRHPSNNADENIYMVSNSLRPALAARSTTREATEMTSVI